MFAQASHSPVIESERTVVDLPLERPLAMPRQEFFGAKAPKAPRGAFQCAPKTIAWRRAAILSASLAMTVMAVCLLETTLPESRNWGVAAIFLSVFACLFAWLSFAFLTCLAGVWRIAYDKEDARLELTDSAPLRDLDTRTALLAPVYNENPEDVVRRLLAIDAALSQQGAARHFHFFILSDTNDPTIVAQEYEAFLHMRARAVDGDERVFYRRRTQNIERKSGNIAEWVRRFGGAYESMVTLDADSVMSAETLIRLAAAMERNKEIGLIQTTPRLVGRRSLFGRIEQFSHRLYGPLLSQGMAWWSGAEANYYGHNAIIRTRAFAENCGLPVLPGGRPFGGAVLSHDFVEAALIRRGGWAVLHAPSLSGSFEECPPTLNDYLDRDRRWCQGNVQHVGILGARGLHWVSRMHLLFGASAYFTAPLWLAFMVLGLMVRSEAPMDLDATSTHTGAGIVYLSCITLLFGPKLLAFGLAMRDPRTRRGFGGPSATLMSIFVQSVFSALLAPVFMWTQTRAVFDIVTGRDSGWKSQFRGERGMKMREAAKRYRSHTILGIGLGFAALAATPHDLDGPNLSTIAWMAPVLIGLALAAPIGSFTARADIGDRLRRFGILCTPEETRPPRVLLLADPSLHADAVRTQDAVTWAMWRDGGHGRQLQLAVATSGDAPSAALLPMSNDAAHPCRSVE